MKKQNDRTNFDGFSNILVDIETRDADEVQYENVLNSENRSSNDNNLYESVFGSNENEDVKQTSDNTQLLVKNKFKSYHAGHRQRARDRFMRAPSMATDTELLELLLFTIIPRADTKETAYSLINVFGNLRNVYNAPIRQLNQNNVNGENLKYAFSLCNEIVTRILQNEIEKRTVMNNPGELLKYCKVKIGSLPEEEFHVLFLDNKMRLIKDKKYGIENVNEVILHVRGIIQDAVELHSCNVVLIHNHPSGEITPSQTDVDTTHKIRRSLRSIGVKLIDHIVVSGDKCYCFSQHFLLKND